ncbi:neural cell adhesion molecule L1-like protein isoform X5 [Betta splendens]|uniref:Neural cell adhesion molecule L1-like protein n=1 Tax=Betta splendens TaxID=158456 RepID=A0A9W2XXL2_BETSP|nr:neural cell adhesion molecule L1-like protein isoform X5 [Betta splendens]
MASAGSLQLALLLALSWTAAALTVPLEVEQPPTIIRHTSGPIVALPFDSNVTVRCEARGNPPPQYRWTKDGEEFLPPHVNTTQNTSGTFVLQSKHLAQFQGKYRCYASNKRGTAMTEEITLIARSVPKFPKEAMELIEVNEGNPFVLKCNPPEGVAPRQIYWMSYRLQHIEQNERVTTGLDGNLYVSNAVRSDSRDDYHCHAAFSRIRTIVQKSAMAVVVAAQSAGAPAVRKPGLLLPSAGRTEMVQTEMVFLKGEDLRLECIPEGFPTPSVKWMKMGEKLPPRTKFSKFDKLLTIKAVEESDQGQYMCTASNSAGETVHYFDVTVEEPPKWQTGPPQSQLAVTGSDVHISCSVSGKPAPDITWRRNGELLRDDAGGNRRVHDDTVVIHNARPQDSGVYQCEASNSHGSILANVNIMVTKMAPLILTTDNLEYAVIAGGGILLNCRVFSSPPSSIDWVKGETGEAIEREGLSVLQNGSLQITNAGKDDEGKYTCVALNTEGNSTVTASLDVKDPTEIYHPPQDVQIVSGTTAQLRCQAAYDESLQSTFEVVWRKDGEDVFSGDGSRHSVSNGMLRINNVNLSDEGLYTCVARTHLDEDNATALLTVLDVPDAPTNLDVVEVDGPRRVRLSWVPGSDHNSSVTDFIVEYEESQWEPGRWRELHRVPGNQATADLALNGHLNYQFRVYAVNAVGPGPPSEPTEQYRTPPAAPDRNPENIKIQGHLPHRMYISWEPLLAVEHNGPGLEYNVSYRKLGVEDAWKSQLVRGLYFVVDNTSTFIPYEVKVQSRNSHGWGPEPKVVTGYSGEDVPSTAPRDVAVELINSTVVRVSWTPVPPATVRGHLGGYNVQWIRRRSLLDPRQPLAERHSLPFPGRRSHAVVPGLQPFSQYTLAVNVYNKKGNGPSSDPVTFDMPEGAPGPVPILTASNAQTDSVLLVWGPPLVANGILTGYRLQYHLINESTRETVDSQVRNISGNDTTQWQLGGLKGGSLYRFHLSACTRAGCGPARAQESSTAAPEAAGDGIWQISQAVNASRNFHVLDGLAPGTAYTVRLLSQRLLENASLFEGVIQTQDEGVVGRRGGGFSTQGWFIGTMCAVALLTLIAVIACFVKTKQGGKYAVKEKEDLHTDAETQRADDDTFCKYSSSDSEERPLKGGSLGSLSEDDIIGDGVSRDSMADYAEGGGEYDEDGSFIGQYCGRMRRGSASEPSGPAQQDTA